MSHGVRIRLDPGWATGSVWTTAERAALDAALVASVNGDGGGTGSPTANVVIQGAGLRLIGTNGTKHTLSGIGSSVTTNGTTSQLVHGDSDYCVLGAGHAGATTKIRSPITAAKYANGWGLIQTLAVITTPGEIFAILANQLNGTCRVPLRVHNGSTLSTVDFTYSVGGSATAIPAQLPRFGIFAADAFGNRFPLSSATPFQVVPAPATPTAWVASNASQVFTYTADSETANPYVLIDTTQFTYHAQIIEVSGAGAIATAVNYFDPVATFTNVLDIRPR